MSANGRAATLIIGHRGAMKIAPENTLASFRLAVQQGCDGIELDVQLTKDEKLVVCHDASIDRTTDGRGPIIQMTAQEVRRYDAGSWFSPAYSGERIPLLEEVFECVPRDMMLNVEIKNGYGPALENALLALLRRKSAFEQVVVSSFDHGLLQRLKWKEAKVRIGLLFPADYFGNISMRAKSLGVDVYSLHPHYFLLNRTDVRIAAAAGYRIYPYTVDNGAEMRRLLRYGVSGIITNRPRLLRTARSRFKRKT
jgi:glycerophosphoryl diester phosphodiesterase